LLNRVLTVDVAPLRPGQIRYSLVCNESGGVLDDVLVYHLGERYLLVVNASNRLKIVDWLARHQPGFDVTVQDQTAERFMLALQGPAALSILQPLADADLSAMRYYRAVEMKVGGQPALVSRTGYTGEDGFEVIVPADAAVPLWEDLVRRGVDAGLVPAGLGCRDTLRLEAGMPLYGHELDEQTDPLTAGLKSSVALGKDFVGRDALQKIADAGPARQRVGLELEGRRIAREGTPVVLGGQTVGHVTSGTFSPTLQKLLAMAFVDTALAQPGTHLAVDLRGTQVPARVVDLPFYRRAKWAQPVVR
jgi:aminomethyltransferase